MNATEGHEAVDEVAMDALAKQLNGFHISVRMQKAAEEGQRKLLSKAVAPPVVKVQTAGRFRERKLPTPKKGKRPVWEPPIFSYSNLEQLIEGQKEFDKKEGSRITFRTEVMDNIVERELLKIFVDWIDDGTVDRTFDYRAPNDCYWANLLDNVTADLIEVSFDESLC